MTCQARMADKSWKLLAAVPRWRSMLGFAVVLSGGKSVAMRFWSWLAFFVVCNILGVEAFKAAMTLPFDEAVLPGVLSVPLIGLTAMGATRVLSLWKNPGE